MNFSNKIVLNSQSSSFKKLISKNDLFIKINKEKREVVFNRFNTENFRQFDESECEIIFNVFENTLKNLTEKLLNKNFEKIVLLSHYEHELDCYKIIYQKIFCEDSKSLNKKTNRLLNKFKIKIDLKWIKNETENYENKISLRELHVINLNKNAISEEISPIDLKRNLKINSEEELTHPISLEEEAFIRKYLDTSPQIIKQKAHYELIGVNVEKFLKELGNSNQASFITINSELYKFYNIDYHKYKFLGSSVSADEIFEEYKGLLSGKWPYLCTSIIDETQTFFYEGEYQIFQVFTPSYESIVHTSHLDIQSPWSGRIEQEGWYSMNKKSKILSAYIFDIYKQFNELNKIQQLGNYTDLDSYVKLIHLRNDWLTYLNDQLTIFKNSNQKLLSGIIVNVMKLLTNPMNRQSFIINHDFIEELKLIKFLDKDIQEIEELVNKLQILEKKHPELIGSNRLDSFNNLSEILDKMINHYHFKQMDEKEEIEEYVQLFNTYDPQGFYNIINELNSIKEILGHFKPLGLNNTFSPYLNRIMGPQEILSQSHKILNNEINFDTYTKERIKVRAWIISKSLLDDKKKNLEILDKIFTTAKHENIHVLVRKSLFNFFVDRKKESCMNFPDRKPAQ